MKVSFKNLLPRVGRAEAPEVRPIGAGTREKAFAIPRRPRAPGISPPAAQEDAAGEHPRLELEAGDFIDRIPHHLLRLGDFDLHRSLSFDLGEIADRIAGGVFTIPLADLLKAMPEMFQDDALALHEMEIRFPWQRVMQMISESEAAQKENGGETLAQKLRRMRKRGKPAAPAAVEETPVETRRGGISQIKRGVGRHERNVWFSKRAVAIDGINDRRDVSPEAASAAPLAPGEAPESASSSSPFVPPVSNESRLSLAAPTSCAPIEPAAASPAPAPNRGLISDPVEKLESERDHLAAMLLQEQQRSAELAAKLEFDLFAMRIESAQIVAEERDKAESAISRARSELECEKQRVIAERQRILREMTARAEAPVIRGDEPLARLRADLEKAEALAAAQAAAYEQAAAQWQDDIQAYRQRLQFIIGEKTALAAKLHQAEIALQAALAPIPF